MKYTKIQGNDFMNKLLSHLFTICLIIISFTIIHKNTNSKNETTSVNFKHENSVQTYLSNQRVQAYVYLLDDGHSATMWTEKSIEPTDFNFSINFGYGNAKNRIDTYNQIFTKDLVMDGTETIDFEIPLEEMQKIYQAFQKYRVSELPNVIDAKAVSGTDTVYAYADGDPLCSYSTPAYLYFVTYTCNDETRTIICNDGGPWDALKGPPDTRNRLVNFVNTICDYIYNTDEYKNMSPINGGYD